MSPTTSPSLLLRIRNADDVEAWQDFVFIYSNIVRRYCLQRRLQACDVDDVTQDVMAIVSAKIKNFDYDPSRGRFRAWLGTVTVNRIRDHWTKQARNENLVATASGTIAKEYADPDEEWIGVFSEQILKVACQRIRPAFNDPTWECFAATWLRNEEPTVVAKSLNVPIHSVYVNKSRVLKRLEVEVRMLAEDIPIPSGGTAREYQ